ncbi:MAG: choice-of-anchor D domain-containing protein [Bacteroidetes bacterium]|nr:choice-of-anchor D domain-containing protein [Bacteroidota bacterium]
MKKSTIFSVAINFVLLVLIAFTAVIKAQVTTFTLYGPETDKFPKVRAYYLAQTQVGMNEPQQIAGITEKNFTIKDNGIPVDQALITHRCSTIVDGPALSVVLVIDKSGSMGEYVRRNPDVTRFEVVKTAAKAFVRAVKYVPPTAISVVSFDAISYLEQDFTDNQGLLIKAIDSISLGGDTRYNFPLLDSLKGAIPMLSRRPPLPVRRVVIFLTDGENNKLDTIRKDSILKGLKGTNSMFFAITVQTAMNPILAEFANASGGGAYSVSAGDIEGQLIAIYKQIANRLQSRDACYIEWPAPPGCTDASRERKVEVTFTPPPMDASQKKYTETQTYLAPEESVVRFTINPPVVSFGNPPANGTVSKPVTITSTHDVIISAAPAIAYSGGTFAFKNLIIPDTLRAGVPKVWNIDFTQASVQAYRQGTVVFNGVTPCNPPTISLKGGITTVTLTSPMEGNIYSTCDDMVITWEGVTSAQQVILQYSTDNGTTWNLIKSDATGNKYVWPSGEIQKLPQGSAYRIRASIPSTKTYVWAKGAGGTEADSSHCVAVSQNGLDAFICGTAQGNVDFGNGKSFMTAGNSIDGFVARYDGSGNIIWTMNFGGPGNEEVPYGIAAGENGESYITGYFVGDAIFGGNQMNPYRKNLRNFFLAKISSNGLISSIQNLGPRPNAEGEAYGTRIAYDPVEKIIYTEGKFRGKLNRPGGNMLISGDPNVWTNFSAKFTESGSFISVEIGTPYINKPYTSKTAVDQEGCLYETGSFSATLTKGGNTLVSRGRSDVFLTKFCGLPASFDVTPAPFTIAKAQLWSDQQIGGEYQLPQTSVGGTNDLTIPFQIYNRGDIPTEITDVVFEDNAQFSLSTSLVGLKLKAAPNSDYINVGIRFSPTSEGRKCSKVTFKAKCSPDITITVCSEAVEPCNYEMNRQIHFPKTLVKTSTPTELDFDSVLINRSRFILTGTVSVSGLNSSDITIKQVNGSASPAFTLNPNQPLKVKLAFRPDAAGDRTAFLNYGLISICEVRQTQIDGEGFESLNFELEQGVWNCVRVDSQEIKNVAINNTGAMDAQVTTIGLQTGANFAIIGPAVPFTVPAGQTKNIQVAFTPKSEGTHYDSLTVTATGSTTLTKSSVLKGDGCLPHIVLKEDCFTLTRIGDIATKNDAVAITNTGRMTLDISAINILTSPSDFFTPTPQKSSIAVGETQNIQLGFQPNNAGRRVSLIEVVSSAVPGRDTIEVCGDAFAPDTTINFGTIYTCETPSVIINYENTSTAPLTIDVSMIGANPNEFSISPNGSVTIPRASSTAFTISMLPTATGTFNAVAKIGPRNVNLAGKAINANLHLATNPAKLTDAEPGKIIPLTVMSSLSEELGTMAVDKVTCKFNVNPELMALSSITPLNGWNWGAAISADRKTITVTGTPNSLPLQKGINTPLFRLDLDYYLGSVDTASVPMSVTLEPDRTACLNITSVGSDEIKLGNICFRDGRLLTAGKTAYSLSLAQPTPARDIVTIRYGVGLGAQAEIDIYNSIGEKIETLVSKYHDSGDYEMTLNVSDLPAGIYFYTLSSGAYREKRRLVIAR